MKQSQETPRKHCLIYKSKRHSVIYCWGQKLLTDPSSWMWPYFYKWFQLTLFRQTMNCEKIHKMFYYSFKNNKKIENWASLSALKLRRSQIFFCKCFVLGTRIRHWHRFNKLWKLRKKICLNLPKVQFITQFIWEIFNIRSIMSNITLETIPFHTTH